MAQRSVTEIFEDHLALARCGDVETDVARNFAADCTLLTTYGVFHGHEGVREAARLLDRQIGRAEYVYCTKLVHGEIAFLEWTAATDSLWIDDGADSFWVHAGLIRVMTIHYTVHRGHGTVVHKVAP